MIHLFKVQIRRKVLRLLLTGFMGVGLIQGAFAETLSKTVLVAVDLSSSTKTHRADYVKYFRMILDTMGARDVLLVTKITSHPSANESLAIPVVQYEEESLLKNRQQTRELNLKRSLNALMLFDALIKEEVEETPIIEVTQNSQRLLHQFKNDRQIIVYLSDMMEYSKSTSNFESKRPLFSSKLAEAALSKVKKQGLVAVLKGVRIYVAGARDIEVTRKEAVKWFWTQYFREAGADLRDYGPDLNIFDECNSPGTCDTKFFQSEREKKLRK